jgi:hypothetical protein
MMRPVRQRQGLPPPLLGRRQCDLRHRLECVRAVMSDLEPKHRSGLYVRLDQIGLAIKALPA